MAADRTTAHELREHASAVAEVIIPGDPDSLWDVRRAVFEKARSCLELARPADALDAIHAYYQTYSANIPEFDGNSYTDQPDCELRFLEANMFAQLGRYDQADSTFRLAISDLPGDPNSFQQVSYYFARRERYADALYALHQQLLAGYSLSPEQYQILRKADESGVLIPKGLINCLNRLEHIQCPDYVHPADLTEILVSGDYQSSYDLCDASSC